MTSEDSSLYARPRQPSKSHHQCYQGQKHPHKPSRYSALRTWSTSRLKGHAHGLLPLRRVCLNMSPWSLTSVAYSTELCIRTSTARCPFSFEELTVSISSISIEVVLLLCLDVGKDSDSNAVDENVLTPTTVSALRDKPPLSK
jgi:hypothetical protein